MATKRRTDYQVDEEALKRMMAGDVTALERTVPPEEEPETKSQAGPCLEKQEKKSGSSRQQIKKTPDGAADSDEYRSRFLKVKLSGARRQTYINDTLYRTVAKVLPVIAPEMSVPMFLGSVLSDHLERYQHIINEIYNQEATQKANRMEEIVYLSIRFGCTAYLLYKVWKQKERIGKICDLLYTPRNRPQAEKDNGEPGNAQDVMGATRFVYLDENAGKTVAPYMSQQLETGSDFIGADKDIPEDEVECKLPLEEMRMLKDEQEELDSRSPEAEAIVPAVTPADLLNVGDVLLNLDGAGSDEDKSYRAAMTLRAIRETDMFELFSSQVENKKLIEELMERYVDEEGNALPLKKERNVSKPVADWRKLV